MVCVCLVGLPGSGKSTVGRQLAKKLHLKFFDSDQEVERLVGCSIRDFFAVEGESSFRKIEAQVVAELSCLHGGVLSTGGGAVITPSVRQCLRLDCSVVYLHSRPEEIFRRLKHDQSRPLLRAPDPLARLAELYAQRDALYREVASIVIETGRPTVAALVAQIVERLGLQPS